MNDVSVDLHSALYELMSRYDTVYTQVMRDNDYKNPFREIINSVIPGLLKNALNLSDPYLVEGSYGKGRWTQVPWISIFDKRITTSAQRGVYIVYLLNKDTKELFLTFETAATEAYNVTDDGEKKSVFIGIAGKKDSRLNDSIKAKAGEIRAAITDTFFSSDNMIQSGSSGYDAGAVYYKKYTLSSLPNDEILIRDLQHMLDLYQRYYTYQSNSRQSSEETLNTKHNDIEDNSGEGGNCVMTKPMFIDHLIRIEEHISSKGFTYPDNLIKNFYLSLKSQPFVILAGTSGTGKTRLVRLFAEAVGATTENGRYKLVSVRPDWSDSSDLFGHVDLNGRFVPGAIIDFIKKAEWNPEYPFFLCLDEMNLARVEYYLSDFLSVMETRERKDGHIVTDPLVDLNYYGSDTAAAGKYGRVILPDNLYVIGTVNMDETTFPFSKKVLDRANTIEFSYVKLNALPADTADLVVPLQLGNDFLKTEYLTLKECMAEDANFQSLCDRLEAVNTILAKAGSHVGYRVRDEIVFYLMNNKKNDLLPEETAFDNEIMQKILPRIQGSSSTVRALLCDLFRFCAGDYTGLTGGSDSEQMQQYLDRKGAGKYPESAKKIVFMTRRFEEDGFTSYWL